MIGIRIDRAWAHLQEVYVCAEAAPKPTFQRSFTTRWGGAAPAAGRLYAPPGPEEGVGTRVRTAHPSAPTQVGTYLPLGT